MSPLAIGIPLGFLAAFIVLMTPRWGSYLYWSLVWMYPVSLLYGTLPAGIRFSDLFIIFLTFASMRVSTPDVLTSRAFRVGALWFLAFLMGNLVGFLEAPTYAYTAIFKDVGKAAHAIMICYVLRTLVRSEREVRRQLVAIALAAIGLSVIGVVQVFAPDLVRWWEVPALELGQLTASEEAAQQTEESRRAAGSLGGVTLSVVTMAMAITSLRIAIRAQNTRTQVGYALVTIAMLAALGFTVTRGAILGLGAGLVYGVVRYGRRTMMVVLMCVAGVLVLAKTDLVERLTGRLVGGEFQEAAQVRSELWKQYINEWSPHYLLFGRGFVAEYIRHQAAAHNSYIGALAYSGLFGLVVFGWLVVTCWRMANELLRRETDPLMIALAESIVMIIIAQLVYGLVNEIWQQPNMLMILFALVCFVDWRLHELRRTPFAAVPPLRGAFPFVPVGQPPAAAGPQPGAIRGWQPASRRI